MPLTKKERARYGVIVRELSRMSRNGWRDAKPSDYQPLERELADLTAKTGRIAPSRFQITYIERWAAWFATEVQGNRVVYHEPGSKPWKQVIADICAKRPERRTVHEQSALLIEMKRTRKD